MLGNENKTKQAKTCRVLVRVTYTYQGRKDRRREGSKKGEKCKNTFYIYLEAGKDYRMEHVRGRRSKERVRKIKKHLELGKSKKIITEE